METFNWCTQLLEKITPFEHDLVGQCSHFTLLASPAANQCHKHQMCRPISIFYHMGCIHCIDLMACDSDVNIYKCITDENLWGPLIIIKHRVCLFYPQKSMKVILGNILEKRHWDMFYQQLSDNYSFPDAGGIIELYFVL